MAKYSVKRNLLYNKVSSFRLLHLCVLLFLKSLQKHPKKAPEIRIIIILKAENYLEIP